jgi:hypothetical protein
MSVLPGGVWISELCSRLQTHRLTVAGSTPIFSAISVCGTQSSHRFHAVGLGTGVAPQSSPAGGSDSVRLRCHISDAPGRLRDVMAMAPPAPSAPPAWGLLRFTTGGAIHYLDAPGPVRDVTGHAGSLLTEMLAVQRDADGLFPLRGGATRAESQRRGAAEVQALLGLISCVTRRPDRSWSFSVESPVAAIAPFQGASVASHGHAAARRLSPQRPLTGAPCSSGLPSGCTASGTIFHDRTPSGDSARSSP